MRLYLVQHGDAVAKSVDPDRPLSRRGREDVKRVAAFLAAADVRVEQIQHSGKTRALETAEILAADLAAGRLPGARGGLDPKDPVGPVAAQLEGLGNDTMLVGHLPFMARLTAHLLSGDEERALVVFQPGSVVCLDGGPADGWQLLWMIRPELLG